MIIKTVFFVFAAIVFSFANVAYGSAVFSGEQDTVDCPWCITVEELEFRNQNPDLVDRIGERVIIFENVNYPNWIRM